MIVYDIEDTASFMNKLLVSDVFDKFEFIMGEIVTFASFNIDGKLHKDYFSSDEQEAIGPRECSLWKEARPYVFQIIKGKKQPLSLKIVLALSKDNTKWLLDRYNLIQYEEQINGLYLNVRFREGKVSCVTGVSLNTFIPDKAMDRIWDDTAGLFLKQNSIVFSVDD